MEEQIVLGFQALPAVFHLTKGSDFISSLQTEDGSDWPAGTHIAIEMADLATWPATISGPTATWAVDKADVDAVLAQLPPIAKARVTYTDDSGVFLVWYTGKVRRHG